jgi:hypothetical protein
MATTSHSTVHVLAHGCYESKTARRIFPNGDDEMVEYVLFHST